ncbi:MAG: DUF444 family protein [Planctomycetota bacterium]
MPSNIEHDHGRFRQIVRGKIKQGLRRFMAKGEMIGRRGKDTVAIPMPEIQIPHFQFGTNQGGVGQGEGKPGDRFGPQSDPGDGSGLAGQEGAEHALEVDVTFDELAKILGEELELPKIEPRGKKSIETTSVRYSGIRPTGPESLRHFKRTFKNALKRSIAAGTYNMAQPKIVPIREDRRYRATRLKQVPESQAAILYAMDVSGSMGEEQKEIVRALAFWIDTWLRSQYKQIDTRYIVHDAFAREVDRETFFHTREAGGTAISSAYRLAGDLIDIHYPPANWNIYLFHFSDGDNLGSDNDTAFGLLKDKLLPDINLFCYGQVKSLYGSGEFKKLIDDQIDQENVVTFEIRDREEIYDAIKAFLGKGK